MAGALLMPFVILPLTASKGSDGAPALAGMSTDPSKNRDTYDRFAQTYDRQISEWGYDMPQRAARAVAEHLPEGTARGELRVLDAGAGTGLMGPLLADAGFHDLVGMDVSPNMLREAERSGQYGRTVVHDCNEPWPFPDGAFDVTTCVGTFTYFDPERSPNALEEMVRVTKPGGLSVLTSREDRHPPWKLVLARLKDAGEVEELHHSEALPYLPNNPEYGDEIGVYLIVLRKAGSPASTAGSCA